MSPVVEEYLYPAIEDFTIDIMLDRGPSARSLKMNLERFTLVGATTRSGLLSVAAARALRRHHAARLLRRRRPGADRDALGRHPAGSRSRPTPRARSRAAPAARRASPTACCAGCATSRSSRPTPESRCRWPRGARHAGGGRARPRRDGPPPARGAHPQVRRRAGRARHAGRGRGRGARHARGGLRALPHPGGVPQAHAARPRGHRPGLRAPRPEGARRRRTLAEGAGRPSCRSAERAPAPEAAMRLEDLDYDLPPGRIAQHPAERREDARLLVVDRAAGTLHDSRVASWRRWLRPGDALALNETRVRPARLDVRRASGGQIELLVVRPEPEGRWRGAGPARQEGGARHGADDRRRLPDARGGRDRARRASGSCAW